MAANENTFEQIQKEYQAYDAFLQGKTRAEKRQFQEFLKLSKDATDDEAKQKRMAENAFNQWRKKERAAMSKDDIKQYRRNLKEEYEESVKEIKDEFAFRRAEM